MSHSGKKQLRASAPVSAPLQEQAEGNPRAANRPVASLPPASLLETVHGPEELRNLGPEHLKALAHDIRKSLIDSVSRTGGHLGAN
ncbi:MAG TPA: 1-deoxy-D-xylulose-5-phosphate synthase N-terminal domain-containing protein, partial [Alphaproteobacteria bacterium]|nr:1-deoxy-D-xylulose-5-phosphate synthase N-terminal domain-containing protein [Alphaproteobacteria bacterium]